MGNKGTDGTHQTVLTIKYCHFLSEHMDISPSVNGFVCNNLPVLMKQCVNRL